MRSESVWDADHSAGVNRLRVSTHADMMLALRSPLSCSTKSAPAHLCRDAHSFTEQDSLGSSEGLLGNLSELCEGLGVVVGDLCEDLAVEIDAGELEAVHEVRVV